MNNSQFRTMRMDNNGSNPGHNNHNYETYNTPQPSYGPKQPIQGINGHNPAPTVMRGHNGQYSGNDFNYINSHSEQFASFAGP